jgi:hypothetical protein
MAMCNVAGLGFSFEIGGGVLGGGGGGPSWPVAIRHIPLPLSSLVSRVIRLLSTSTILLVLLF